MFTKCGSMAAAQLIFDQTVGKSVISWTATIAGFTPFNQICLFLWPETREKGE